MKMAASIFILAFTLIIWEANTQQCGGSIFINPLRPPLAEESQINNQCRPIMVEESPIFVNPLGPPYAEESPIFINPLRPQFKTKPPFTEGSSSNLPVPRNKLSVSTPLFKGPSFSVKCTSSEPLSPLSVKTSLSNASQDFIFDCTQSLPSNSGNDLLLSSEKPIKFYGPAVNVEVNNIPLILPKPVIELSNPFNSNYINAISSCNEPSSFDCSLNTITVEPPKLLPSSPQCFVPNCFTRPIPVTINRRPVTGISASTRGLEEILSSLNNDLPCCDTLEYSVPSVSVAEASSSVSVQSPLRSNSLFLRPVYNVIPQSITQSSAVSEVTNPLCINDVPQYSQPERSCLNFFNSPGVIPSFTQSSASLAEASSSFSSGQEQANSAASATSVDISSLGISPANPFTSNPFPPNFYNCPVIIKSSPPFTSIEQPFPDFKSTGNAAEASSSVSSGLGKASSSVVSLNVNPFGAGQVNPSPCSSNIFGCPATDPTCSYTSILPVSSAPTYQSSVNVAETSSISSSIGQAASSSSTSNIYPFGIRQVNPSPYSSNIFSCPEIDPTCSYTSIPPVPMTPSCQFPANIACSSYQLPNFMQASSTASSSQQDSTCSYTSIPIAPTCQSSVNVAETASSISSGVGQAASASSSLNMNPFGAQQINLIQSTPYSLYLVPSSSTSPSKSSVNVAEATSSASSGFGQASSSTASLNITPFSIGQINPSPYSSNIFGCPETDPTCSFTSIPPVSMTPSCRSSVNVAEAYSSTSSGLGSCSVPSFGNPNLENSYSSNIFGCPETDPTCSHTSIIPVSITSPYQPATSVSETSSSVSSGLGQASSSSSSLNINSCGAEVFSSSTVVSETACPLSTSFAGSDSQTTTTSTATSSSPSASTASVSSTSTSTTNVVEQSAPVQGTIISTTTSSHSSTKDVSNPFSCYPSQNMFNLEISPLTLEVEIPSSITSSIVSSNLPRSYGPHAIKIPSCIPAQLSCSLRTRPVF